MRELELLIIEADPGVQAGYLDALQGLGCHASFSDSVALALNLSSIILPDLIILTVESPERETASVIERIRRYIGAHRPYIILASRCDEADSLQRGLEAGADQVLVKPVAATDLSETVQRLSVA